jgi:hypothetical protein
VNLFHNQYERELCEIAKKYPKVAGYIVYLYHPAMIGSPVVLVASGYAEHMLWDSKEKPDRKSAFARFMQEQFYNGSYVNRLKDYETLPYFR